VRPVFENIVELEESATRVIKDAIQDDADAASMARPDQFAQCVVSTEQRVDSEVVVCMIAVVTGGLEDGSQIESIDSQRFDVVKMFDNTEKVPTPITFCGRCRVPRLKV
jgi:hypothetical protein